MPGRDQEPSFQLASGTTNERDNSYNILNTPGSIFYNTDTSNVEFSDNVDISGKLVVHDSVTFPDGTSQTTAAGGGAAGFTPVLFTGGWNSDVQQLGGKAVIPDVIYANEGMTPGNGTQNIPYGYSNPTAGVSYFKVSEEMAGIYTFTIMVVALAYNNEGDDDGPTVNFERFLLGRTPGNNSIPLIKPQNLNQAHETDPKTFILSATTRLLPEEQMEFKWASAFKLKGTNSSNPGGWMSITKVSS